MAAMRSSWNFLGAGQLTFGPNSLSQLGPWIQRQGLQRLFVITDQNLLRIGLVDRLTQILATTGARFEIFGDGQPEPSVALALQAYEAALRFKPDGIVGLGGGSNMDLAKILATLLRHGGTPSDYFGFDRVPGPILPLACIPTTAGTGSEVSHAAVLTDEREQIKVSTLSSYLRPQLALVDPTLTYGCPAKPTADSGMDALTHAIEAFTAVDYQHLNVPAGQPTPYEGKTPMGDLFAEKAIRLIAAHLVTAVRQPQNEEARHGMALAATLAGLAFSNCAVAVVHALEYPLGAVLHVSHGAGNGLLLPFVMRYNLNARPREFAQIAEWMGVKTTGLSEQEAGEAGIQRIEELKRELGIPENLRQIGATRDQLPGFAEKAFSIKRLMLLNPRSPSLEDLQGILAAAF
jgi:alcohol dehydrogenase class IV